jgi:CheY-like chemotaxis protein
MATGGKTILIVDDDRLVQRAFKLVFERHSYRVLLAEDGNEALATLASHSVDAVLLDVLMPDREGIETLIEIKRRHPALPVVVISGGGVQTKLDFLAVAKQFGADAVLKKPILPEEMVRILGAHIARAA